MKAFVIMCNRLTWPKKLCKDLTNSGCEVILIDNGSTYPPLLEWYRTNPYPIHYLKNIGCKSLWESGVINMYDDRYYIVTDHDLDISGLPKDWIDVLMKGLDNKSVTKSGLSLQIDDLPANKYADDARLSEYPFWAATIDGYYSAPIDTTLAIYDRTRMDGIRFPFDLEDDSHSRFWNALRSPLPYQCKHMPWYNTLENLTDEERYYIENIGNDGYWSRYFLETWK